MLDYGWVFGVTKLSLVKQKISCCKCSFQNTVIVQDCSIYGLCMHKETIIIDIYYSSIEYLKIFLFLYKMVIGVTFFGIAKLTPLFNNQILIIFVQT